MSADSQRFLDPKNDFAFKRIFGQKKNKDILIAFLNDILDHKHIGEIQDVKYLNTVQDPEIAALKQSILDVLCEDQTGAQYIVEIQVAKTKGFEKRAQYYAAKAYSSQLLEGEQYDKLKEVIFVAITDFIMFPDKKKVKTDHIFLDKETGEHDLRDFYFTFIELPRFTKSIDELSSNLDRWYYYLKHAPHTGGEVYEQLIVDAPIIERAYKELDKSCWSPKELRTYDQVIKRDRDNAAARIFALEEAEEKGKKKGIEKGIKQGKKEGIVIGEKKGIKKGREEGIKKGREEGREEEKKEIALQMLQEGMEVALISKLTGLESKALEQLQANA